MKLKIYKRGNIYWGRTYVIKEFDQSNKKTELFKSSRTSNYKEAKKIIENWFYDLCYEIRHGKFKGSLPLLHIIRKTLDHYTQRFEQKEITKIQYKNYKNYITPFERFVIKEKIK